MIFDCFTYCGEKELLSIRMNELSLCQRDWVTHVIVESSFTFSGKPKPLYFEEHKSEFAQHKNIMYLRVDDMPNNGNPWDNERWQRNKIMLALNFLEVKDDDLILISDVDEVPRASAIDLFTPSMQFAALIQDKFGYYLNCMEGKQTWNRARIMLHGYLKYKTPEEVRNSGFDHQIDNAGWHWSWLGGVDKMVEKFNSFSHQELNNEKNTNPERLLSKLNKGQSLWSDDETDVWKFIEIDESFPAYLYNHQDKFNHLIK